MPAKHSTFEEIKRESNNINLSGFIKFTQDFSINLPKTVAATVFKKTALYSREMYFENFKYSLMQLMKETNKLSIKKLTRELKDIKKSI